MVKKQLLRAGSVLALSASLIFTSCSSEDEQKPVNREADSLRNINGQLSNSLNEKESAIQEFIETFNEIQENLNAIKEKEKIVTTVSTRGDVKSRTGQIREDIQAINDLMTQNRARISSLTQKLKQTNLKLAGMEKMIENMQTTLNQKEEEITELKGKIEGLNIELTNLQTNMKEVESESARKTDALNTAYYAIGTGKELKEKKVIEKEGGFIGLGKSTKLSPNFNREYFTRINIEQTTFINIGAKKMKILSNHPASSYKVIGDKPIEKIQILNPQEFWSSSKYLVVMIE